MPRNQFRTVAEELAGLREGRGDAVARFVRDHAPAVLGWCIRLSGPDVDPSAMAERVMDDALRRLDQVSAEMPVRAMLLGQVLAAVAQRESRPWWRRSRAEDGGGPRARRRVRAALAQLPLEQRVALVLVDIEGLRVAGASALLGIPTGEVAQRLSSARKSFSDAARREGLDHAALKEGVS